jgi:diguanylate cyclase (GGDEF)-like protein
LRSILAFPLKRQDGKVFGMLSAQSYQPSVYSADDQTMLELLAAHAATALDNARLFGEVQRLAITDPLTGLYNRRHFLEAAQIEFERALRYDRSLSLMMLDLDQFKEVNDTFGHLTGDQVLIQVATRGRDTLRNIDILGRFGGDEMVVLMPETELRTAYQVAERLRRNICDPPIRVADLSLNVSASIGIVAVDSDCPDLKALLARADQALYTAKNSGRNRTSIWSPRNRTTVH